MKQSFVHIMFLIGFLLFALGGCSGGTSSTAGALQATVPAVRQLSPTPTRLPAGTVLYQADWSHGLAGWSGTHGWKVAQGQLESDSSGSGAFIIPYRPAVSDYAVEVRVQIVLLVRQQGGSFTISAPKAPGRDGYQAGVSGLEGSGPRPNGAHPQSQVFLTPSDDTASGSGIPHDYEPGSGWHTYRVEVQGNAASFLDNGVEIGSVSSQQTDVLSNGPIEFSSDLVILRVSNLRILAF
jgi:Domain of Unknown Function (DUF1080)